MRSIVIRNVVAIACRVGAPGCEDGYADAGGEAAARRCPSVQTGLEASVTIGVAKAVAETVNPTTRETKNLNFIVFCKVGHALLGETPTFGKFRINVPFIYLI